MKLKYVKRISAYVGTFYHSEYITVKPLKLGHITRTITLPKVYTMYNKMYAIYRGKILKC